MLIGGEERRAAEEFEDRSPIDRDIVVSRFPVGTRQDVRDAVAAARAAFPAWRDLGWRRRLEIMRRAADLISERQFEYAALMAFEVGKNRLEALGDVEETADLLRYYSDEMETQRRLREADGLAVPDRAHPQRPQAPRRVGGDQPVQLPDGAGRRPGRRGADRRQHGGPEALVRCAADRPTSSARRCAMPACRPASSTWSPDRARRSARSCRRARTSTAWSSPAATRSA